MDKLFIAAIKDETFGIDYFEHIGVGKINATYNTLRLINIYKPKIIINYGTAGAVNKNLSGIIECTKFYQRDMDVRGLGFKLGQTPFENDFFVQLNKNGYSCGTGDSFVMSSPDLVTDVVDMEAYSYAKFCKINKLNFICFKFISDNADNDAGKDWSKAFKKGAKEFSLFFQKEYEGIKF